MAVIDQPALKGNQDILIDTTKLGHIHNSISSLNWRDDAEEAVLYG